MSAFTKQHLLTALVVGATLVGAELALGQGRTLPPRELAPGVIITIEDTTIDDDAIDNPREFSELLSVVQPQPWQPHYNPTTQTLAEKAKSVTFQREVWSLEIGFKPLRIIQVGGRDVWYLLYFVRNNGGARAPQLQPDGSYTLKNVNRARRFLPTFIFQSHGLEKAYYDRTLPEAVAAIAAKERVPGKIHSSATIGRARIAVSTPNEDRRVWGVATWDNVDPRSDFISIYVQGLTNAYRWQPPEEGYRGEAGDRVSTKTLQLNFWRPGDEVRLHEEEIRYGIPLYPEEPESQQEVLSTYQLSEPVEYQWVFR